jgi:hypothetical protein
MSFSMLRRNDVNDRMIRSIDESISSHAFKEIVERRVWSGGPLLEMNKRDFNK